MHERYKSWEKYLFLRGKTNIFLADLLSPLLSQATQSTNINCNMENNLEGHQTTVCSVIQFIYCRGSQSVSLDQSSISITWEHISIASTQVPPHTHFWCISQNHQTILQVEGIQIVCLINLTQLWHHLPRLHRWRAQSHETALTSDTSHKSRLSPVLLANQL